LGTFGAKHSRNQECFGFFQDIEEYQWIAACFMGDFGEGDRDEEKEKGHGK